MGGNEGAARWGGCNTLGGCGTLGGTNGCVEGGGRKWEGLGKACECEDFLSRLREGKHHGACALCGALGELDALKEAAACDHRQRPRELAALSLLLSARELERVGFERVIVTDPNAHSSAASLTELCGEVLALVEVVTTQCRLPLHRRALADQSQRLGRLVERLEELLLESARPVGEFWVGLLERLGVGLGVGNHGTDGCRVARRSRLRRQLLLHQCLELRLALAVLPAAHRGRRARSEGRPEGERGGHRGWCGTSYARCAHHRRRRAQQQARHKREDGQVEHGLSFELLGNLSKLKLLYKQKVKLSRAFVLSRLLPLHGPMSNVDQAERYKSQGNAALQGGLFSEAVNLYTQAIALDPNCAVFFSNRSAAYANMERWKEALDDAQEVVGLKPEWVKGHTRRGAALHGLKARTHSTSLNPRRTPLPHTPFTPPITSKSHL